MEKSRRGVAATASNVLHGCCDCIHVTGGSGSFGYCNPIDCRCAMSCSRWYVPG